MSRYGKQPIIIPENVKVVKKDDGALTVSGPHGELERFFRDEIDISIKDKEIKLTPTDSNPFVLSLWGTYAAHIRNMITGVVDQFEKKLVIEGVGYRVELAGEEEMVLSLGFSHQVRINIPKGIYVSVKKNMIIVKGSDKEKVGEFCARIRSKKKPEPYKGKGIRYEDEVVRRKQGKKSV